MPGAHVTGVAAHTDREARLVTMDSTLDAKEATAPAQAAAPSDAVAAVLSGAVEQARQAIVENSGDTVGEYLGVSFEDETAATHRFLANMPGYQGWQWAVVVAAYEGADHATLSEVVLVPGPTALLAPAWVPWDERIKPGDLSPGDLLAPGKDDPRLAPGYTATGDPLIDDTAFELGFGRRQVLSALGRDETAQRWHDGDHGPDSPMARATKRVCRDCGFMVPLAGALGAMFGVCCNEMAADSRVVDFEYGCGAHSDTPQPAGTGSPLYDPYDDGVLEVVEVIATPATPATPEEPEVSWTPEVSGTPQVPESPASLENPEAPEGPEASEPGEQA
ncbi:hypothetical protein Y900_008975 [Mycolicibacterium aromaticivorans JS19b1 = JCM 16368]|uniref:DUF3027 domain-containing protein n=2 Tax=Mycolicibacterium aromaticivorans TaxID=318425 RepID=A0A064CJV0_9MYCO|nr:hypothetical protein Y900_008975 [Mycolicibacterium aromaticivorans JS19b1 = JCM 16368]